jgi:hypothetical protein
MKNITFSPETKKTLKQIQFSHLAPRDLSGDKVMNAQLFYFEKSSKLSRLIIVRAQQLEGHKIILYMYIRMCFLRSIIGQYS